MGFSCLLGISVKVYARFAFMLTPCFAPNLQLVAEIYGINFPYVWVLSGFSVLVLSPETAAANFLVLLLSLIT